MANTERRTFADFEDIHIYRADIERWIAIGQDDYGIRIRRQAEDKETAYAELRQAVYFVGEHGDLAREEK